MFFRDRKIEGLAIILPGASVSEDICIDADGLRLPCLLGRVGELHSHSAINMPLACLLNASCVGKSTVALLRPKKSSFLRTPGTPLIAPTASEFLSVLINFSIKAEHNFVYKY